MRPILAIHRRSKGTNPISKFPLTFPETIMRDDTYIYPFDFPMFEAVGGVSSQKKACPSIGVSSMRKERPVGRNARNPNIQGCVTMAIVNRTFLAPSGCFLHDCLAIPYNSLTQCYFVGFHEQSQSPEFVNISK
jgi:hypothetical protein